MENIEKQIVRIIENSSPELAAEEILRLLGVVGRSEKCFLHSPDWNGKCFKCGEQVFVRENK